MRTRKFEQGDVEDDEEASEPFDLIELLDSDVELRHWVASGGQVEGISGLVERDEVCFTRASNELAPFASEHEGYMGTHTASGRLVSSPGFIVEPVVHFGDSNREPIEVLRNPGAR